MDFPIFHLDFLNNRFLIAIIAVLHVLINHPMAVGGIPLVTLLEWRGQKAIGGDQAKWDKLALKILFIFFLVTTTIGAMTGVGIWFSASLVNPVAIGSLIRVFFWAWFVEWIVFVTEVVLILFYFLTWKKLSSKKLFHVRIGILLSIASWITMAIIVAILGFMMDPGNWRTERSLLSGFLNPLYLPQLAFRTPMAMVMGGVLGLFLTNIFVKNDADFRTKATKVISKWILAWVPFLVLGCYWYYRAVPTAMVGNLAVANTTQQFASWYQVFKIGIGVGVVSCFLVAIFGALGKLKLQTWTSGFALLILLGLFSHFERVREFIRKPYAVAPQIGRSTTNKAFRAV